MKHCFYILTFGTMVTPYTSFGMDQFLKSIGLVQETQQQKIEAIALDPRNQEINHKLDTIKRLEKEV